MEVVHLTYPLIDKFNPPIVLAIGYFDGVHKGHQQVIKKACALAKEYSLPCGVMTFSPHPKEVLGITKKIDQLTPLATKLALLENLGVDYAYVVKFSKEFAAISPEAFVNEFLLSLHVKGIVVGFDFTFGAKGSANAEKLINLSKDRFFVEIVEPFNYRGNKISSTLIRSHLLSGDIQEIKNLLGRNFSINGVVIHGNKRGRTIGFPTANLKLTEDYLSIKNGVYVVKVHVNNKLFPGVMNIGYRPTIADEKIASYEVHLLDYSGDLYDQLITVELVCFIREEQKFNSLDELKLQINKDVTFAKKALMDTII